MIIIWPSFRRVPIAQGLSCLIYKLKVPGSSPASGALTSHIISGYIFLRPANNIIPFDYHTYFSDPCTFMGDYCYIMPSLHTRSVTSCKLSQIKQPWVTINTPTHNLRFTFKFYSRSLMVSAAHATQLCSLEPAFKQRRMVAEISRFGTFTMIAS